VGEVRTMEINNKDMDLVKAFLARESMDYGGTWDATNEKWCAKLLKIIVANLAKHADTKWIHISSSGNVGVVIRRLHLYHKYEGKGIAIVRLCTCGDLKCWGSIVNADEYIFDSDDMVVTN
jgi:hypothetical protein